MLIIFLLSHQPNSGTETHNIIEKLLPHIKDSNTINIINIIIRKLAHIIEYFILTYLIYSLLKEYNLKRNKNIILSIIFSFLYSLTDEFHQSFIIGRTSEFTDCLIDTSGSFIFIITNIIYNKLKKHKNLLKYE